MAAKKEDEPQGLVKIEVADGQIVRDVTTKKHVRAGGFAEVPARQYDESMGEIVGGEAPPPKKRRSAKGEGVSDV